MIKDGFTINECDKCVYTKTIEDVCIIACLYVDDLLIFETNIEVIKSSKKMLSNNFDMKDLGVAYVILKIKISRTPDGINLSQSHYVDKMIKKFKKYGIKGNTNFFLSYTHLYRNTGIGRRQLEYYQIIENLMCLMNYTRLDIAYTVNKLSRYTNNPSDDHWTVLLRVVGYLKNTKEYALRNEKYPLYLKGAVMQTGL